MTVIKKLPQIQKEDLELHEVFPLYSYYYYYVKSYYDSSRNRSYTTLNSELSARCQLFIKDEIGKTCNPHICSVNFLYLGRYLYYLKQHFSNDHMNKLYACTYFSYKLKQELKNFGCRNANHEDLMNAYNKINTLRAKYLRGSTQNFDICNGIIEDFDDITLKIFSDLDELYKNFYEVKGRDWNRSYRIKIFDTFKRLLSHNYVKDDKHHIKDVLKQYKKDYDGYTHCRNWNCNPNVLTLPRVIYNEPSGESANKNNKASVNKTENHEIEKKPQKPQKPENKESLETPMSNDTDKETKITEFLKELAEEARNEEKLVEVSTSTTVLIFTVLIVIFLLYKYTVVGSYLNPRATKLKKLMKKRNNIHLDLIDSFERSYNNSFDNTYEIGYRLLDY